MNKIIAILAAVAFSTLASAQTLIEDLPAGAALSAGDPIPTVQSAITVKTTPAAIRTYINGTGLVASAPIQTNGVLQVRGAIYQDGINTPAAMSATETDYNPPGIADTNVLYLTPNAAGTAINSLVSSSGGAGGRDGRELMLINVSDVQSISLVHESGSGTATYRFHNVGSLNFALSPGQVTVLHYDDILQRWRPTVQSTLAAALTGIVGVAGGGTGVGTLANDSLFMGNGTSAMTAKAIPNCGSSTQALSYDTTADTWGCQTISAGGGSPGGSDTQVQYNNAGAFGGDPDWTWVASTNLMTLGTTAAPTVIQGTAGSGGIGAAITLRAGVGGTTFAGGAVTVDGGAGGSTSGNGGNATVRGGAATDGDGGSAFVTGRNGTGTNRAGGQATITGGNGTGSGSGGPANIVGGNGGATSVGANVNLTAGAGGATSGNGGAIALLGGFTTDGNGGGITITGRAGGGASGNGGTVTLTGGTPAGTGVQGRIIFASPTADTAISLQVPTTGFSITVAASVSQLLLNPAGTLASGTITLAAGASDGQRFCAASSQTITSLTVSPGAGQTIATSATALPLGRGACFIYNTSTAKWFQTT